MTNSGVSGTVPRELLIDLTISAWRLAQAFERLVRKLSPDEGAKYAGQLRYFQKQAMETLASADLSIVSIEGQPYDAGAAATPLNIADFGADDVLVVDQMLEPIMMSMNGIVRPGVVLLAKAT